MYTTVTSDQNLSFSKQYNYFSSLNGNNVYQCNYGCALQLGHCVVTLIRREKLKIIHSCIYKYVLSRELMFTVTILYTREYLQTLTRS
jgi:hypothetical protein